MKNEQKASRSMTLSMKVVTFICSAMMLVVLAVPIWQIQLTAPQYPEGLVLEIWANKLAGNVDIINGLNHYIGMRQLHAEDFMEFTVLPYIIGGYAALGFLTLLLNRRRIFNAWFVLFLFVAVLSMADFYRWEYNYGHELNPDAPIIVPGMAYQPPLIGYKKLLNFGAYSIPDTGGWIFVGVGFALLITWYVNWKKNRKASKISSASLHATAVFLLFMLFSSCSHEPQAIKYGAEACDFCKMTILDGKYASQVISTKGKVYKFDDSHCLFEFLKNGGVWRNEIAGIYFSDFAGSGKWLKSDQAIFLKSDKLRGPMGGTVAVFTSEAVAKTMNAQVGGEIVTWQELNPLK